MTGLAFSSDNGRLAWGGADGWTRICDAQTGEEFTSWARMAALSAAWHFIRWANGC